MRNGMGRLIAVRFMDRILNNLLTFMLIILVLQACRTVEEVEPVVESQPDPDVVIRVLEQARVSAWQEEFRQQRYIADILYDALKAIEDDRLLTPENNNAFARFRQVLAIRPDNEVALQGIQDIVSRYIELAQNASRQGQFAQAETMLLRARIVDPENPAIAQAQLKLAAEINSKDLFFELDAGSVANQTDSVKAQLADIAQQTKLHDALFIITSPNDDHARWMFSVMREAVPGYRLRGNIELSGRTLIRLRMPVDSD